MRRKEVKVLDHHRGLLWDTVTVEADSQGAEASFDSFLGNRTFFLRPNHRLTLRVRKRHTWEGDRLSLSRLVTIAMDWTAVPWRWA